MISWLKTWFNPAPIIRIVSTEGAPHISPITGIRLAASVKPQWFGKQHDAPSMDKFSNCPGMADWMNAGYILLAHTDIKVKANSAGTAVVELCKGREPPSSMNQKLVAGVCEHANGVKFAVTKIPLPWSVYTKSGYSAHVLPAMFHSPFLDDLFVYPGTVDYDGFATINFVFTAKRACEIEIPAGTPLLQIIPFKREVITGQTGPATASELAMRFHGFPTRVRAAYRKHFHKRKKYTLESTK